MRIDEKIGTEYETEGVSDCRVGRLATGPAAHFQRSRIVRCPECLVSLLNFDVAEGGSFYWVVWLFPTPYSPIPQYPTPRVACETVNYSVFIFFPPGLCALRCA